MSNSLQHYKPRLTRHLCPWDSSGKKTGVSSYSLLQRILPSQGLNLVSCDALQEDSLPCEPAGSLQTVLRWTLGSVFVLDYVFPQINAQEWECRITQLLYFWFLRDLHPVLHVAVPIYLPTNSAGGFLFLHILSSSYYLSTF